MDTVTALSRREATLRSAAMTSLAGIALLQAIGLPSLLVQGRQLGVLSMAAMAVCIGLGWALTAAPAGAAAQLWRAVAATGVLVVAGWAVPHAFGVPGLAADRGNWTAMRGSVCGLLALACLVLAVVAMRPTRAALRGLVTSAVVMIALAPGVAALLVALGPGVAGGETVLASGGHIHSHGSGESAIVFQPLPGGRGGRYVYQAVAAPHPTVFGIAVLTAAGLLFIAGAVAYLRARTGHSATTAPSEPVALAGVERGLA